MIWHELKKEFSIKSFGFSFPKAEAFFTSQWKWPPIVFVIYRLVLAFFTVGSLSAFIAKNVFLPHHLMAYMTSWSYILLALHFNFSAIIVVYRFYRSICLPDERDPEDNDTLKSDSSSSCSPSHISDHVINNYNELCHIGDAMNNCILPGEQNTDHCNDGSIDIIQHPNPLRLNSSNSDGLTGSNGCTLPGDHFYTTINRSHDSKKKLRFAIRQDQTRWYLKISWALFEMISSSAIIVTVLYFTAIYPHMSSRNTFEDISVHGINSVLVIFEMIVSAYPVRLLHALYTIVFGLLYIIFTLIYWSQSPLENIIYRGMLDWNRPKNAIILTFVLLFLVVPFLQTVFFLLYKCRLRCYRSLYNENYMT